MDSSADDNFDAGVDDELYSYANPDDPKSFLLFAGAGSGKTRSLVTLLERIVKEKSRRLWLRGQRIRVITYTNAACDEINRRLRFNPLIEVSTIHSFCWSMIETFHDDIREWLREDLQRDILNLEELDKRGRPGTKAAIDRQRSIASKRRRLDRLDEIRRFTYSPTGENTGQEALNHTDVISIASAFLEPEGTLARILVNAYPVLLIDESQDTNQHLMDALLRIQEHHRDAFCLGLIGDMMQRIYADGKAGLADTLPSDWATPKKVMNHRCPPRVVRLLNNVRAAADKQEQKPRSDKLDGHARLFILPTEVTDKAAVELQIADRMSSVTNDTSWSSSPADYKTLTLEHHMAARRAGFIGMFEALHPAERLRTGLLDGTLAGLRPFVRDALPLVEAARRNDEFGVATVMRQRSPLLALSTLKAAGANQQVQLESAQAAVDDLMGLWAEGASPRFLDVLVAIIKTGIFEVPDFLQDFAHIRTSELNTASAEDEAADPRDPVAKAWDDFLQCSFEEIFRYASYVSGLATSATHQGVKGLEFPRVMVVIDDTEARGFMFNYGKLFGDTAKTDADMKNERDGKETSVERTRRLFYVTCSRAEKSLAVVVYSSDPKTVRETAISENWFDESEIELMA